MKKSEGSAPDIEYTTSSYGVVILADNRSDFLVLLIANGQLPLTRAAEHCPSHVFCNMLVP